MGISNQGDKAEEVFRKITGFSKPDRAADGDAFFCDTKPICHYIEVKKVGGGKKGGNTLNQVRAIKYNTLVVFDVRNGGQWYVVPAHEVAKLAAQKKRGQHTESPFESCTLNVKQLSVEFKCSKNELADRVKAAARAADQYEKLRELLKEHENRIRQVVDEDRAKIKNEITWIELISRSR